ncbi:hypothetical protein AAFF_G00157680 [Aldrovandia affinis]|uniref:Uncharacterized protein n=1 Tax=Aldrovandia affinis TaxID=143900 RepID=A0AAD7RN75_9TELE|nr:hypothetical protein AAFF_G00157680 [Aldrovandia affinis]
MKGLYCKAKHPPPTGESDHQSILRAAGAWPKPPVQHIYKRKPTGDNLLVFTPAFGSDANLNIDADETAGDGRTANRPPVPAPALERRSHPDYRSSAGSFISGFIKAEGPRAPRPALQTHGALQTSPSRRAGPTSPSLD